MQSLRVSDVMNPHVISVEEEASLNQALELLQQHHISALVVVAHGGHMVGVISQTDLLRAFQGNADADNDQVSQYMTRDVVSVASHKSLGYAMRALQQHKIHRLVVVESRDGGRFASDKVMPVGVLSQTDIVRKLAETTPTDES